MHDSILLCNKCISKCRCLVLGFGILSFGIYLGFGILGFGILRGAHWTSPFGCGCAALRIAVGKIDSLRFAPWVSLQRLDFYWCSYSQWGHRPRPLSAWFVLAPMGWMAFGFARCKEMQALAPARHAKKHMPMLFAISLSLSYLLPIFVPHFFPYFSLFFLFSAGCQSYAPSRITSLRWHSDRMRFKFVFLRGHSPSTPNLARSPVHQMQDVSCHTSGMWSR